MAAPAISNPAPAPNGESKSARKKKAKAEAAAASANGSGEASSVVDTSKEESVDGRADLDGGNEHPHIKELQKQIRNISKKLSAMQKTDAVIDANPGVSLDDLVSQRKINADQRASAQKKPGLLAQRTQLEEQVTQYRQIEGEFKAQLQKQKDDLVAQHEKDLEAVTDKLRSELLRDADSETRKKLLVFSQFLRAAATKRAVEEDAIKPENMAFEGALFLVYGGDGKAVETAVNIIEGTEEQVPGIDGELLPVKYSQVKQASIEHGPFQNEEEWVEQVAEATITGNEDVHQSIPAGSDPTIAHAGLTELDAPVQTNGLTTAGHDTAPVAVNGTSIDNSGNVAGERWDTAAGADKDGIEDSYEMIPRPNEEVDAPLAAPSASFEAQGKASWADEPVDPSMAGNLAGESWSAPVPGGEPEAANVAPGWGDEPAQPAAPADDGYQQVANRRGGRGASRGDGERGGRGRGRGRGGFRGDGERGRGRGGRGGRGRGDGPPRS